MSTGDPTSKFDLVVAGGTVVTEAGTVQADIGVTASTIASISTSALRGCREIDATGMLVLPGVVDAHTHFNSEWPFPDERRPADDFAAGTAGAAAGGVTTVCDFVYPLEGERLPAALNRVRIAASSARIDVALHVAVTTVTQTTIADIDGIVAAGCPSFKFYTALPEFVAKPSEYHAVLARIGAKGGLAMFHCEDAAILASARDTLERAGRTAPRDYPLAKPVAAEVAATAQAITMAAEAGVASYIVHLSAGAALDVVVTERQHGTSVFVETRPLYLYLTADRYDAPDAVAARYIGTPPLREAADRDRLWAGLSDETIDTIGSDHVGFTTDQKYRPGDTYETVPKGSASVETMLSMLYSVGVLGGRVTLERLVQLTSTNPARIFGLYPQKGTIAVGSDADICIFDPRARRKLSGSSLHSSADLEPFEGTEVTGGPAYTIARGSIVYEDGVVTGLPGRGRFIAGRPGSLSRGG